MDISPQLYFYKNRRTLIMDQRSPNHPKIDNLLLALIIMSSSLLFTWTREIYVNGWSLETFFNIATILLFLLTSYSIESKIRLSTTTRGLFYFSYFFYCWHICFRDHLQESYQWTNALCLSVPSLHRQSYLAVHL